MLTKSATTRPKSKFATRFKRDWRLYTLLLFPIIYFIIFKYLPMYGIIISFKNYNIFQGIFESQWIGLENFAHLFKLKDFQRALRNTLLLNSIDLFFSFPVPIILSLCLNEIINIKFKKLSQTILYMPYFLSWVVVGGIMYQLFSTNTGIVNLTLGTSIPFLTNKFYWLVTYLVSGVWQSAGWNTIIYLAAISGIDQSLYEAADVDGGGKMIKILHITLPGIKSTIVLLLVIKLGSMMAIGFERPFVMGNTLVSDFSDVISTYVYRLGLQGGQFSFATAAGLFQALVGLLLISAANLIASKMGEQGIW